MMQTINRVLYVRAHYIAMRKRTECRGTEEVHLTRVVTRQHAGGFEFHSRNHIDGGDHLKPPVSPLPATIA